jgi:long-chain acyl-CoA synthetase
MLTHRCVFTSTAATATIHLRTRGEVVVSAMPLPHVYGNVVMNAAFLVGMTLVSAERFDAGDALALIEAHSATMFEGVPTMYYYMLDHPNLKTTELSTLRRCTVGGQTMPLASILAVEEALGCPLLELWGMTEVAGPAISHSPYLRGPRGSIGMPIPSMEAKVVAADGHSSQPLAVGEAGELAVRGPLVMTGYFGNPAATAEVLDAEGWLRTGDIATVDEAGCFTIVDRKKDMIITAGYKVYPAELEAVIATHPAVAMVAVGSVRDALKGELAKAFIVLRPDAQLSEAEAAEYCRARLAAYKVPRQFAFVAELPRTSTGKIMRRALREGADATTPAQAEPAA